MIQNLFSKIMKFLFEEKPFYEKGCKFCGSKLTRIKNGCNYHGCTISGRYECGCTVKGHPPYLAFKRTRICKRREILNNRSCADKDYCNHIKSERD